jgi:hypothetical protein
MYTLFLSTTDQPQLCISEKFILYYSAIKYNYFSLAPTWT